MTFDQALSAQLLGITAHFGPRRVTQPGPGLSTPSSLSYQTVLFSLDPSYNNLSMSQTTQEGPEIGHLPAFRVDIGTTYRPSYGSHPYPLLSSLIPLVT